MEEKTKHRRRNIYRALNIAGLLIPIISASLFLILFFTVRPDNTIVISVFVLSVITFVYSVLHKFNHKIALYSALFIGLEMILCLSLGFEILSSLLLVSFIIGLAKLFS